ncbi:MAG: hypothetical protein KKD77_22310, partial [Gammaproteobacteria bacterium]|nr:hypothetical protein [Gammaproteobacteria bacterium]
MSYEQSTPISSQIKRLGSHLPGLEESFNERGTQPKMPISTLPEFNAVIWGIHSKALTIVGARTSQGKSSLALQLAYDLANQGIPTLFLSLEMTTEALIERMFCNVMKVNNRDLLRGRFKVDDEIQAKWGTFKALVSKIPLLITCGVGKNFREVNELIKLLNPKPKAIFVDYIQNIALNPKESRE